MARSPQQQFIWAVGQQESGGNYRAVNASSGALGRWQIMPANLPGWARECGMPVFSAAYFLSHPLYQDRMAQCKLGRYYRAYGPRGAAAVWYSGQPNWHATYGNPPVYQYVADVIAIMGGAPSGGGGGGGGGGGPSVDHTIHPPRADWSPTVRASATHVLHTGRAMHAWSTAIRNLRG